jgi:hypothetical protein
MVCVISDFQISIKRKRYSKIYVIAHVQCNYYLHPFHSIIDLKFSAMTGLHLPKTGWKVCHTSSGNLPEENPVILNGISYVVISFFRVYGYQFNNNSLYEISNIL